MHEYLAATDRLLLVHPDAIARETLARTIEGIGLRAQIARSLIEAEQAISHNGPFGVIIISTSVTSFNRFAPANSQILNTIKDFVRKTGQSEVILLTEETLGMDLCCDLIQSGISGFIDGRNNRFDAAILTDQIDQARQRYKQSREASARLHITGAAQNNTLVWQSPVMADLLDRASRAAQVSDVPILILGESGTGKQLLAELIHQLDPKRGTRKFHSVNCSAISGTLAESTIFGHVKGAFTGASTSRKGIFRTADGGTVLLDEIGEMEMPLQPKLLRVLQEHVVMPLGADEEVETDVRVIAATNRHLGALAEEGKFRLDLYQRLNVITLEIPPLRERREDIPALVQFFLKKYANYYDKPIEYVDPQVYEFLASCPLYGNVRELENTVRQTLAFKRSGSEWTMSDIPPTVLARKSEDSPESETVLTELVEAACRLVDVGNITLPELVNTCEKMVLRNSLQKSSMTSAELAKQLGLSRRTLYNKIQKYDLAHATREN